MEKAMGPVGEEIDEHVDLDGLQPNGLAAERAEAAIFSHPQHIAGGEPGDDEDAEREDEEVTDDRLGEQDGGEPIDDVGAPAFAEDGLRAPAVAAEQTLDEKNIAPRMSSVTKTLTMVLSAFMGGAAADGP